ncbi:hypothetical protein, partial [Burkholderia sp. BCC0405]|uniref:hypothetical protein n=1 Tax=Burkholderia sp. BCC0405 TaxID=2676298 RepID=UPI001ABB4253
SVNRLFFMTSFSPLEAILSSFNWSENSRAGQRASVVKRRNGGWPRMIRSIDAAMSGANGGTAHAIR